MKHPYDQLTELVNQRGIVSVLETLSVVVRDKAESQCEQKLLGYEQASATNDKISNELKHLCDRILTGFKRK